MTLNKMYIVKNALKNLKRNKSRNLMIGSIIFVIVLTIVISMVINNTATAVIDDYKDRFGSQVFITPNFEKIREDMSSDDLMMTMPELTSEQYLDFAQSDYLKKSSLVGNASGDSDSISAIDDDSSDNKNVDSPSGNMMVSSIGIGGGNFKLLGDSWNEFDDGSRKLESGSLPKNEGEAIISTDLRKKNGLEIGDSVKFNSDVGIDIPKDIDQKSLKNGEILTINGVDYTVSVHEFGFTQLSRVVEYDFVIVGFYDDLNDPYADENMPKLPFLNNRNDILTTLPTLLVDRNENEHGVYIHATYYLQNPDLLEQFESEIRTKGLPDTFDVGTDSHSYNAIVKPVEGLKKITTTFMLVVIVLGSLILMLLTSISIGERKYEIGVLRAMGMKEKNVVLGLWFELMSITTLCLILGLGIGALLVQPVSDKLLLSQITSQNDEGGMMGSTMSGSISIGGPSATGGLEEMEIQLEIMTIVQIIIISVSLTSIAGLISMRKITQYEPIKILMERN